MTLDGSVRLDDSLVVSETDRFAEQQDGAAPRVRFCVEDEHGGSPLAAGLLARSRALLAADHEAEALEDARTRRPAAQAVTPADGAHGVSPALVGAGRWAS